LGPGEDFEQCRLHFTLATAQFSIAISTIRKNLKWSEAARPLFCRDATATYNYALSSLYRELNRHH
jgi:hypothetical protein